MFNRNSVLRGPSPDFFVSAKTSTAIRARHPALREALVQASLDPAVRSIGCAASAPAASGQIELDAVILQRDDGRYLLDVVPARRPDDGGLHRDALRVLGLPPLVVTSEDLRAEPRRSNVDLVWSHHGRAVPLDLRLCILQVLVDDGPLHLGQLLQRIRTDREPAAAVMSLACSDLLELDLTSDRIGPATLVRSRS
jgi:hypothetical protein